MKILHDLVLVKPHKFSEMSVTNKSDEGEVISIGDKVTKVSKGDTVVFLESVKKYGEYLLVREDRICIKK